MHLNLDLIETHIFHPSEDHCDNFSLSYHEIKRVKWSNLRKFAKPLTILTKDCEGGKVLKLVVPPNLLKQENVCLIPREAEHPSTEKLKGELLIMTYEEA